MTLTNFELIKRFLKEENGAVTVDWVVLTAAIVGLGIAVIMTVSSGTNSLSGKISGYLVAMDVGVSGSGGYLSDFFDTAENLELYQDFYADFVAEGDFEGANESVSGYLDYYEEHNDAASIDVASVGINTLSEAGQDVSALQERYDSAHSACSADPTCT